MPPRERERELYQWITEAKSLQLSLEFVGNGFDEGRSSVQFVLQFVFAMKEFRAFQFFKASVVLVRGRCHSHRERYKRRRRRSGYTTVCWGGDIGSFDDYLVVPFAAVAGLLGISSFRRFCFLLEPVERVSRIKVRLDAVPAEEGVLQEDMARFEKRKNN